MSEAEEAQQPAISALKRADRALASDDRETFAAALSQAVDLDDVREPLHKLLHGLAAGREVAVTDSEEDLSPSQAADRLGVSRKLVNKMLDAGQMAYRTKPQSTHKVIPASEVLRVLEERELFATLARVNAAGSKAAAERGLDRAKLHKAIRNAPAPSREDRERVDALVDRFEQTTGGALDEDAEHFLAATDHAVTASS